MRCPLCAREGPRDLVHKHLADDHTAAVETWTEAASGRMRYRVQCPVCGDAYEARVKPRSHDPQFLETFAYEIRLVAFDMLLNHLEAEHEALKITHDSESER
jgi:predicted nucleic acid-binding protein